jgi:hypothetical protein
VRKERNLSTAEGKALLNDISHALSQVIKKHRHQTIANLAPLHQDSFIAHSVHSPIAHSVHSPIAHSVHSLIAHSVHSPIFCLLQEHGVTMFDVVLVPAGTLPKTTSGKLRRFAIETAYTAGNLNALFGIKYRPVLKSKVNSVSAGGILVCVVLVLVLLLYQVMGAQEEL